MRKNKRRIHRGGRKISSLKEGKEGLYLLGALFTQTFEDWKRSYRRESTQAKNRPTKKTSHKKADHLLLQKEDQMETGLTGKGSF